MNIPHTLEQVELMDKIFNYHFFEESDDKDYKFYSTYFDIESGLAMYTFNEMIKYATELEIVKYQKLPVGNFYITSVNAVKANNFKSQGGFKAIFLDDLLRKDAEKTRQNLSDEKLKYDVKNAKRIFKTYWWSFTMSILAFLLSLGKIIYDILM